MKPALIPARGTVEFLVYTLTDDDDPNPDISIDGPERWSRPVVGLIESPRAYGGDDDPLGNYLPYEPVVVNEIGLLYQVYDYANSVMGGMHWDHCSHFYWPHIDGPVSDAPRIRVLSSPSATA